MIQESKKLWFRKAFIFCDAESFKRLYESKIYAAMTGIFYKPLDADFLSKTTSENFRVRNKKIACIDLTLSEEEIFKKFNDTAQKHVRRAERNPDVTILHEEHPGGESYDVYKDFEYSQGRVPMSKTEFSSYRLFSASYKGQIISGISLLESHPYIRTITIYSKRLSVADKETYKIIAQSSRKIVWEISKWAKQNGFVQFDLGSVNLTDPAKAGISDFKLSFGGELIDEYTYMYKSNAFLFFEKFVNIKLLYKKIVR